MQIYTAGRGESQVTVLQWFSVSHNFNPNENFKKIFKVKRNNQASAALPK